MNPNPVPTIRKLGLFASLVCLTALVAHAGSEFGGRGPVPPDPAPIPTPGQKARIDVAFVLDTTGSMSGLLEGAKRKIWSIANQMATGQPRPEIRIALVGYRDRGDAYVTRIHDLTTDIDAVYAQLQAFEAGGGGDTPESVNEALHSAITKLDWSGAQDVYKVVFLVGDAPPHMDYQDDVSHVESVRLARERGIVINTVQCGDYAGTTPVWQTIANAGAGHFAAIRQDGGMVALVTPQDEELARLNRDLAATVLAWGDAREVEELEDKRRRALAADAPAAASRLGYLSKTGGRANLGRADLVDAVASGDADLAEIEDDALPPPMRTMAPLERETYVKERQEARAVIQRRIAEVSTERDGWVRAEQERLAAEGKGDGFDAEVMATIRVQAAEAGIAY